MSYKFIIVLLILTVSLGISQEFLPGQIIVKFQPTYRGKIQIEEVDGIAISNIPAIDQLNTIWQVYKIEKIIRDPNPSDLALDFGMDLFYNFYFPPDKDVKSVIKDYEKTGVFQYAEPSFIYKADVVPNDPLYTGQWHLSKIQCPSAWDFARGDSLVKVMVIDCGIDFLHEDLSYSYSINVAEDINHNFRFDPFSSAQGGDFDNIDQDQNGYVDDVIGYDFLNNDANPYPPAGDDHATECAGVPVAMTNNGRGVAGISWGCRYVDARCGTGGYIYNYLNALYYAVTRQVWVISMSFGGSGYSQAYNDGLQYCWQAGIVLVASAGNEYSGGAPKYPACYPNVIATAASDQSDHRSDWGGGQQSNYATWVDVTAPGSGILTTDPYNNAYGSWDGTSFSCPCVVGEAALLKSVYPSMTNAQCTTRIFQSCDSMPDPQYIAGNLGHGRINVAKAIYQPIRCNLRTTELRLNDGNNNYPEPDEPIALITTMSNEGSYQNATNVSATLSCSDPQVTIIKNTATYPIIVAGGSGNCSGDSFVFKANANVIPHRARFIVTIASTPQSLHTTDTIYINVGLPRILLVDDDAGADYERCYKESIDSLRTLYRIWTLATAGSPPLDTLLHYPVVVWFTGLDSLNTLSSTDQTNLTSYLNQGKNLFICGQNIGQNIGTTPFYTNYLHASYVISHTGILYSVGVPGDPIGGVNGDTIVTGGSGGASNATSLDGIRPVSGAYGCFRYRNYADTTVYGAIRYEGSYKVIYFGLPFEAIDHAVGRYIQKWDVMRRILEYFNEPLPGIEQEQPYVVNSLFKPSLHLSPNPFSMSTRISLSIPKHEYAELNIYNATGTLVKNIITDNSSIIWNGKDRFGNKLNGIYFFELKTSYGCITQKAVILR